MSEDIMSPFKIATRQEGDGKIHGYIEMLSGKEAGKRYELSTQAIQFTEQYLVWDF